MTRASFWSIFSRMNLLIAYSNLLFVLYLFSFPIVVHFIFLILLMLLSLWLLNSFDMKFIHVAFIYILLKCINIWILASFLASVTRSSCQKDEMNGCVVEKCNHLSDAIGKIDEAIEQIELLNISVKKQRLDVLLVASTCEELCAQIKIGECSSGDK